jgi:heme-degrading monooxygenase HmoA
MENPLFVVTSELTVDPDSSGDLIRAFNDRVGLVDSRVGFDRLEVWQDCATPQRFVMTSWWESRQAFVDYMRSDDHRASHARIPAGPARPRPVALHRHQVVAR